MKTFYLPYSEKPNYELSPKVMSEFIHPDSVGMIPEVLFLGYWNYRGIAGKFSIYDNSVLAECGEDMMSVWNDSCVEMFLKPTGFQGHFSFEFNAIGKLYACYIKDEKLIDGKFKESFPCSIEECQSVKRNSTIREIISPEQFEKINWSVEFFIPIDLLQKYFGFFLLEEKLRFRANFYKCGNNLKSPHWLSWNPIQELNFHVENYFGEIILTK